MVNGEERHSYDTLNPGDVLEVISAGPHKQPEPGWLNHCNATTARLLRNVLARVNLKDASQLGREKIHPILKERGVLDLIDVASLDPNRVESMLGLLSSANLDDLYAAIGGGSIYLNEFENALDLVKITRAALRWTSIHIEGSNVSNRPGGLAYFAGLVSEKGGNIIRAVHTTTKSGGFHVRMVLTGLDDEQKEKLYWLFKEGLFLLDDIEIA